LKIHFNINLSSMPRSSKWSLSIVFPAFYLDSLTVEEGTDMLSRNVGSQIQFCAAENRRRAQISPTNSLRRVTSHKIEGPIRNCYF
jgi:hypothetical protein